VQVESSDAELLDLLVGFGDDNSNAQLLSCSTPTANVAFGGQRTFLDNQALTGSMHFDGSGTEPAQLR
jgi:hypothetical protein